MRKLLVVLFVCIAFCAHARVLHVDDNVIKLSQTKTTDPALHVRVGDEVWYGAMCTNNQKNTLHVKFNNIVYDVIEPFTDTTNYTYDESGRLIGANENIYLESTGTQKINTYVLPSLTLVTNIGVTMNMNAGSIVFGIMDSAKDIETYRLFNYLGKIYFDINGWQSRLIGTNDSFMQNKYYEFETGNFYVKNLISGEEFSKKNWNVFLLSQKLSILYGYLATINIQNRMQVEKYIS